MRIGEHLRAHDARKVFDARTAERGCRRLCSQDQRVRGPELRLRGRWLRKRRQLLAGGRRHVLQWVQQVRRRWRTQRLRRQLRPARRRVALHAGHLRRAGDRGLRPSAGDGCGKTLDAVTPTAASVVRYTGDTCESVTTEASPLHVSHTTACNPTTCAAQKIGCGSAGDGCGNLLNCYPNDAGACSDGGACESVTGGAVQCVPPAQLCTPTTCGALGDNCGYAGDNCGNLLNCNGPGDAGCAAPNSAAAAARTSAASATTRPTAARTLPAPPARLRRSRGSPTPPPIRRSSIPLA